jgi:hypothetical protein
MVWFTLIFTFLHHSIDWCLKISQVSKSMEEIFTYPLDTSLVSFLLLKWTPQTRDLWRIRVYLANSWGSWEVQDHGTDTWWCLPAASWHDRGHHMVWQQVWLCGSLFLDIMGACLKTLSNPTYLPKASLPNTTNMTKTNLLTYQIWGTNIQIIVDTVSWWRSLPPLHTDPQPFPRWSFHFSTSMPNGFSVTT